MEWVFVLSVFLVAYIAIVTKQIQSGIFDNWMLEIKLAPVILILLFGVNKRSSIGFDKSLTNIEYLQVYSVFTVLYRVFTFNDCPEAAEELQRQIKEARGDLTGRGFKFIETS